MQTTNPDGAGFPHHEAGGRAADHWPELARRWQLSGPPLRVAPADVEAYREASADLIRERERPRLLLLGVTPEIRRMAWPEGTELLAVDRARAMIELVWPGPPSRVLRADWTALPLPDGSRDLVLCDGGFHLLTHPEGQARLVASLRRVVAAGGLCLLRLFVPPKERESPDEVLADLRAGGVASIDALKVRLGMALQRGPREGVRLDDVWQTFQRAEPDAADLAARVGWSVEKVRSIEAYRGSASAYHFATVDEVADLFCRAPGGFALESVRVPSYALGERFPLIALRRSDDG